MLFGYVFYFSLLFGFIFINSYKYLFVYIYWVYTESNKLKFLFKREEEFSKRVLIRQ